MADSGIGGAGGEFAQETGVTSVPGTAYTVVVGAAGTAAQAAGDSHVTIGAVTVYAHGSTVDVNGTGVAGTGSSNTTHHDGGTGGAGQSVSPGGSAVGGGGGSSGGTGAAGNNGQDSTSGGAGASAPTGGGPGGAGGQSAGSPDGMQPVSGPGGGGGGGFLSEDGSGFATPGYSGSGYAGQVKITWSGTATAPANVFRFLLDIPAGGGVNGAIYGQLTTGGTVATVNVVYGTGGTLKVVGYNSIASQIFTSSAAGAYNGVPVIVSVELTQSGSNVAWALKTIPPGVGQTATTLGSGTVAGSVGTGSDVIVNSGGTETGAVGVGCLIVQYAVTSLPDLAAAASGYDGERGGDRFTRLCAAAGIGSSLVGNASDTPQMGPQADDLLINLLQGIEDFDHGQMFEAREFFGMTYRTRVSMQAQSPAVTYDYSSGELAQPLKPTADLQQARNDVTVSRAGGSSARQYLASGAMSTQAPPNGIGSYPYSLTAAAHADSQCSNCALWIMTVGTVAGNRYPQVNIDLARREAEGNYLKTAAMGIGDFFKITNPPTFAESATVKELAFGFTETLNAYARTIQVNAVPEAPYEEMSPPTW